MTREDFDTFVRRVEAGVGRRPTALRRRVILWALIGYAGLLLGFIATVVLSGLFFLMLIWADTAGRIVCSVAGSFILLGGGWAALQAVRVRGEAPVGRKVQREEAPALFEMLDTLRTGLRCVPFHHVMIVPACNASVAQVPRLGLLGWPRNHLQLGLPLMEGLSRDEMHAVIAHEFAHLSRQDGRFGHWLYRLRRSWEKTFEQFRQPQIAGQVSFRPLIAKYVDWFWPRFNAHAFVFSRAAEYSADAVSAQVAGGTPAAMALVRVAILTRMLDDTFWPGLWKRANSAAEPPPDAFRQLSQFIRQGASTEDRQRWINEALRTATTNSDTHPCLRERLAALHQRLQPPLSLDAARLARSPAPSAAETLLGPALETIRRDVQEAWINELAPHWRDRHARATSLAHRLSTFEQAVPDPALSADSLWEKVTVLGDLQGDKIAEPLIRQVLALQPGHALANFQLGRILLEACHPDGESFLDRAATEDEELTSRVCGLLHDYYRRTGQTDRLKAVTARLDRFEKDLQASQNERREVTARDRLIAHGLEPREVDALRVVLQKEPELAAAFLGRKELNHFPRQRMFLLCLHPRSAWHRLPNHERDRALASRLSQTVQLPGRVLVFVAGGSFRALARKVRVLPGAEVFRHRG